MNKRIVIFMFIVLTFCAVNAAVEAAAPPLPRFFMKTTDYPMDDSYAVGIDPNVLFLLDTGSPMTMTPKGRLPMVDVIWDPHERAKLLEQNTYGTGMRPLVITNTDGNVISEMTSVNYYVFGRDLDITNNIIGNPFCYYSPYPNKPYYLTFKDPDAANWNGIGNIPGPTSAVTNYLPGRVYGGEPVPKLLADKYLVPNDSRMYQMKLVLWRLLSDENRALLSRMKLAMANSYQEFNYPYTGYLADFYKSFPFGAGLYDNVVSGDPNANPVKRANNISFDYGTGPDWSTGLSGSTGYTDSSRAMAGVDREYYGMSKTSNEWIAANRSVLRLPFDYLYRSDESGFHSTPNLAEFRRYINGIHGGDETNFLEPELIADGKTPLSTSIYGRDYHLNGNTIQHAGANGYSYDAIYFEKGTGLKKQYYNGTQAYLQFQDYRIDDKTSGQTLRAGLGVGSVVDFFSPRADNLPFVDGGTGDTRGYFPVIGSCQSNWLVVFTAGNDSDPDTLKAHEAVKKLYDNTKTMRGRKWNKTTGKWESANFTMDSGVRTLVVGFVDPEANDEVSVNLRTDLTSMANYGNPYPDGSPNLASTPYFANDVTSLISNLKSVLMRINADRFASSAPVIFPQGTGNAVYSPSYKVNAYDQWDAWFSKYRLVDDDHLEEVWELNEKLLSGADARRVFTTNETNDNLTAVDLIENIDVATKAGIPASDVSRFTKWLHSYKKLDQMSSNSVLGDMEHSGFMMVGDTAPYTNLPFRPSRVYLQTNRGVLHSVNDETGKEEWAFIPPNIFQSRLKSLKFETLTGQWIEGDGITHNNSIAGVLLDGGMSARDVRDDSESYRTVLIGNMGWGGNGFYAMDVTTPSDSPKFLWAIDNARYGDGEEADLLINGVRRWGNLATMLLPNVKWDYSNLGLTIVNPVIVSVDQKDAGRRGDVGLLPGGLGYRLGMDDHGKVLYAFDPLSGTIIKPIGEYTGDFVDPTVGQRDLGMMISPIIYVVSDDQTTKSFYTADSQGNVLYCDTSLPVQDWKLESIFQLLSSGASGNKPIAIPKALVYAKGRGEIEDEMIFGGTSDLMVPDFSEARKLENPEQYIWGHDLTRASGNVTTADFYSLPYMQDNPPIGGTNYGVEPNVFVGANPLDPDYKGWALKLRPPTLETKAEYVTTAPYLYYGVLYVSTFVPKPIPKDQADLTLCPELGDGKLYAFEPFTGSGMWPGHLQALVLKDIKVAGMSSYNGKLYLGVKPLKAGALENLPALLKGKQLAPNLMQMPSLNQPDVITLTVSPDIPYIQYWKETY
ncbi:MAG: hypothetical protein LBJ36_08740 [Synergistaceae bacterium]|jgi:type IV pilus assembly protein PilY1|nr:hypothetical protein [Synergistaceae bacterium]